MQKEIQSLKEDLKTKEEMSEQIVQLRVAEEEKTRMLKDLQEKLLASRMMPQLPPGMPRLPSPVGLFGIFP